MVRGILGKKVGMTQIFDDDGQMIPVTVVEAGPCVVVQKRSPAKHKYSAIQIGYEQVPGRKLSKPRLGVFERADRGTLLLDEIGEMPSDMQVKLLRVLQEGEFERVGGIKTLHVDVRLVAATHRDLEAMVEAGEFRQDLYFRLNVIAIRLPPLAEREGDIPLLANFFLASKEILWRQKVRMQRHCCPE